MNKVFQEQVTPYFHLRFIFTTDSVAENLNNLATIAMIYFKAYILSINEYYLPQKLSTVGRVFNCEKVITSVMTKL